MRKNAKSQLEALFFLCQVHGLLQRQGHVGPKACADNFFFTPLLLNLLYSFILYSIGSILSISHFALNVYCSLILSHELSRC